MGARFGVGHCYIANSVDGEGVVKTAVIAKDAAVAMGRIFTEAHVGDNEEGGEPGAEEAYRLNDGALRIVCCGAEGVFHIGGDGNAEKDYGAEAFADKRFEVGNEFIEAPAMLIGEGRNQGLFFGLVGYEEGVYEHGLIIDFQLDLTIAQSIEYNLGQLPFCLP